MVNVTVYNTSGEESDQIEIDPELLGEELNISLLHQAVTAYEANQRQGSANTKTRAETAYSNAKPWPQKNTGRARHGERGSPIWVGGGITYGPRPRDYSKQLPKKMKRRALDHAFLSKLLDDELLVVEGFELPQPKTRLAKEMLDALEVDDSRLILTEEHDERKFLATRNLPDTLLKPISDTNAYEVLKYRYAIVERPALKSYFESRAKTLEGVSVDEEDEGGE